MEQTYCQKPCANCPFKKESLKGWLGEKRMQQIVDADSFVCHKDNTRQCAGHLIVNKKDKDNSDSMFLRVAKSFGIELDLKNEDSIFDTKQQVVNHHKFPYDS